MHRNRKWLSRAGALLLVISLAGCSLSPLSKRTAAFSSAAVVTTQNTANAYQVVEQSYYNAQVASLVVSFDKDGFHPERIQPFMSAKNMEVRTRVIDGLRQYAETLAEVSGDQPLNVFDTQAAALGKSLQSMSKNGDIKSLLKSANISTTDMNVATTAVDALGKVLIERKRSKELPAILKEMRDPIIQICTLLEEDIGTPEKSGLRNQLKNDYDKLERKQEQYIYKNTDKMTAEEKRAEIERLPKLEADRMKADQALAATQAALVQLAKTHTALVDSANKKNSPAFKTLLSELIDDGKQLHSFYENLPSQ